MKKRYLIGLILCCLMIIPLIGCSSKGGTSNQSTATPKTPLQTLNDSVRVVQLVNDRQDQNIFDLSNRISGVEARTQVDLNPLTGRVTALESLNYPALTTNMSLLRVNVSDIWANLAFHSTRLASLEGLNISQIWANISLHSTRLTALESANSSLNSRIGIIEGYSILTRFITDEGLIASQGLNISTIKTNLETYDSYLSSRIAVLEGLNISARLATIESKLNSSASGSVCAIKPIAVYPEIGNMSVPNGSVLFKWANCNASAYEFYIGDNSNTMAKIDTLDYDVYAFLWPAPSNGAYYFWRIVALSPCGNISSTFWFKTQ